MIAGELALALAEKILADRKGPDLLRDEARLAALIEEDFGTDSVRATNVARMILEDREGHDYYSELETLADYIETQLG